VTNSIVHGAALPLQPRSGGGDEGFDPGVPAVGPRLTVVEGGQTGRHANLDGHISKRLKAMIVDGTLLPGEVHCSRTARAGYGCKPSPDAERSQASGARATHRLAIAAQSLRSRVLKARDRDDLRSPRHARRPRCATGGDASQPEALRELFHDIDATDTRENRCAYLRLRQDYLFHSGILEIAASPLLGQTTNSVNIFVLAFGAGLIKSIREHRAILDALRRRNPDAAEAAMRAHIHQSVVSLHHEADLLEPAGAEGHQSIEAALREREKTRM
jgi:FCD domain